MSTTIALSEALKTALETLQDELNDNRDEDEEYITMNDLVLSLVQQPNSHSITVSGHEKTLSEHISVEEFTREELKRIRNEEGFTDYEAVIRDRAGLPARETGEEPIEVGSLDV